MKDCSVFIISVLLVCVAIQPLSHVEHSDALEQPLSLLTDESQTETASMTLDLTSWHLSEGDYIQFSNYGDDYFQLLNNSGHSPEMTSSFFQINVLEDQPCDFGGYETICYVISQRTLGNLTWYDDDGHHGGHGGHDGHDDHDGDHDDHDDHDNHGDNHGDDHGGDHGDEDGHDDHDNHGDNSGRDDHDHQDESMDYTEKIVDQMEWNQITQIYPDFSAIHVDIRAKWDSWTFDYDYETDATGNLIGESNIWENETHLSTFTGIPENITVGSQWFEEIESTISVSYNDNYDHGESDTWQQMDMISYLVTEELEIELPPNQATNSEQNVSMSLLALEARVNDEDEILYQVTNDFFKYKYFNFEPTHNQTANQQNQTGSQDGEHNDDDHGCHEYCSHVNYYSYTDLVVDSWYISAYIPDDDGDGLNNSVDQCPNGQIDWISELETDFDGDGCRDIDEDDDDDNDGFLDIRENECLSNPLNSTSIPLDNDGTGECDALDDDDDDDGTLDVDDAFPFDSSESKDNDADGIGDNADFDDDNDSFLDSEETRCNSDAYNALSVPNDLDQDLLCDILDSDDDGDSYSDAFEDECESDSMNATSIPEDTDNDGNCNLLDNDDDNDGWLDITEISCLSDHLNSRSTPSDLDEDGVCDEVDTDLDGDGVNNSEDSFPLDPNKSSDSVAGEQDDSSGITYIVAVAVIFGLLVVILSLRRRGSSQSYENEMTQVEVEQEYDRFVDENGTHWLRKSDGNLLWWNGSEWIDYHR